MFTVGCVRAKVSVRPHVSDEVSVYVIFKGGVFEFICHGQINNGVVLC